MPPRMHLAIAFALHVVRFAFAGRCYIAQASWFGLLLSGHAKASVPDTRGGDVPLGAPSLRSHALQPLVRR